MVVSFKISRNGTRYRPKHKPEPQLGAELGDDEVDAPVHIPEIQSRTARKRSVDDTDDDHNVAENLDAEVSFILNIFPDGYTIVPYEQDAVHDDSKSLCPYDRRSESLITAIELGQLPVDFLDDIPCKYTNGTVTCEVRDYRKESSESAVNDSFTADFPSITKVSLKMSPHNIVKDINLISDTRWEYGDFLEAESRVLLALYPKLCLDPTPNLDRLCKEPTSIKLNLDIRGKRLKRLRQLSDSENSNSSVRDSGKVTSQPYFVKVVDNNVCQSNMIATRSTNHAPVNLNTGVRDSIRLAGLPEFVNVVDQNVGQSNTVVTGPTNHATENSNMRVPYLTQLTGQFEFVNAVDQNAGQSNMNVTGPTNRALEKSNTRVGDLIQLAGQPEFVNVVDQNVGQNYMTATGPTNHATENSNMRVPYSKRLTGQFEFVKAVDQNVGQSNMIITGPTNHAVKSNARVGDLIQLAGQPEFVNVVDQNVGQSNMIATGPTNHAPENSNIWVPDSIQLMGQFKLVNAVDRSVGQRNVIKVEPGHNGSSFSHRPGHQIGVGNSGLMQDHANDINSSSFMHFVNDKRGNHCQVLSTVNLNKRGRSTHASLDGNQVDGTTQVQQPSLTQQVLQNFTRSNFLKAPWNNMSPNLSSGSRGPQVGETQSLTFNAIESAKQEQMGVNQRLNILQKTPVIGGSGSSSSGGNIIGPVTASSPVDRSMQNRFSKIQMVTARFDFPSWFY